MAVKASLQFTDDSPASAIEQQLELYGLNLFTLLDPNKIVDSAIPSDTVSLALIGNYGRQLWDCMPATFWQGQHPVDDFSSSIATQVLTTTIGANGWTILFPDQSAQIVPALQNLGQAAGWHNPSPLGNGIHPEHGLWFAYRAVVAMDFDVAVGANKAELPANEIRCGESPCISCIDQPCIRSCPASALSTNSAPDLKACANFRSRVHSPCAERCLARQQCPVGLQSRYSDEQIRYFYKRSLRSLQSWVADTNHKRGE